MYDFQQQGASRVCPAHHEFHAVAIAPGDTCHRDFQCDNRRVAEDLEQKNAQQPWEKSKIQHWLVGGFSHLKNIRQIGSFHALNKYIWNHHLVQHWFVHS